MFEKNEGLKHDRYLFNHKNKNDYCKEFNLLNRFGPSSKQIVNVNVASSSKNSLTNESHH